MKIVVCAPDDLLEELKDVQEYFETCEKDESTAVEADVLIYLYEDGSDVDFIGSRNVIINSVAECLKNRHYKNGNVFRFNGWPGFIMRDLWEIAGDLNSEAEEAAAMLGKKLKKCADEPGFVSARILAMIINEACFAKQENISTEDDIDIAMKLGTGYPSGPFEWGKTIGFHRIHKLLHTLSMNDERYIPAKSLSSAVV